MRRTRTFVTDGPLADSSSPASLMTRTANCTRTSQDHTCSSRAVQLCHPERTHEESREADACELPEIPREYARDDSGGGGGGGGCAGGCSPARSGGAASPRA